MSENEKDAIQVASDITPGTGGETEHEAQVAEQNPEVVPVPTPPKAELLDKAPSPLHESLAAYISRQTGWMVMPEYTVKIVQLVLALHGEHQASNEWKAKKAALDSARAAEKQAAKQKSKIRTGTQTAKKVDEIGKALAAGIEILNAGVKLPDDVMSNLRTAAEAAGIVLPGDEPKPEPKPEENPEVEPETSPEEQALNSEVEAKPKATTTPRRTPKAKPQPKAKVDA